MSTLAIPTIAVRTVVADPDETPDYTGAELGGILVWTNRSQKYPIFEIEFLGDSPASPGDSLTGSNAVVIHVENEGTFDYKIHHRQPNGKEKVTGTFSVRSCGGC